MEWQERKLLPFHNFSVRGSAGTDCLKIIRKGAM